MLLRMVSLSHDEQFKVVNRGEKVLALWYRGLAGQSHVYACFMKRFARNT